MCNYINQLLIRGENICGIVVLTCVCNIAMAGCEISPVAPNAVMLEY